MLGRYGHFDGPQRLSSEVQAVQEDIVMSQKVWIFRNRCDNL